LRCKANAIVIIHLYENTGMRDRPDNTTGCARRFRIPYDGAFYRTDETRRRVWEVAVAGMNPATRAGSSLRPQ